MADASSWLLGPKGRRRPFGAVARMATVKHLTLLPRPLRFFAEPFENWIASACLISGVLAAAGQARPLSLVTQAPSWMLHIWGVMLCIGGAATLVARWRIGRPQTELGARSARALEVFGLAVLATAIGVYAIAILAVGVTGLSAGTITAAMAASCAMRGWIVARELKQQRADDV